MCKPASLDALASRLVLDEAAMRYTARETIMGGADPALALNLSRLADCLDEAARCAARCLGRPDVTGSA